MFSNYKLISQSTIRPLVKSDPDIIQQEVDHLMSLILAEYSYDVDTAIMYCLRDLYFATKSTLVCIRATNQVELVIENYPQKHSLSNTSVFLYSALFYRMLEMLAEYDGFRFTCKPDRAEARSWRIRDIQRITIYCPIHYFKENEAYYHVRS